MEIKVCLVATGFFLLLGTVTAQTKAIITADPASGKVVTGSQVKLTCGLDNGARLTDNPQWKKGSAVLSSTAAGVTLTGEKNGILTIVKAATGDAGSYTCKLTGATVSDEQIVVVEAPQKPTLTCTSSTIIVGVTTTKCTCASTNDPVFVPMSYEFKVADKTEVTNTPKKELTVTGATALEGREVRCQARFHAEATGLSPTATLKLTITPNEPKLECFPPIVPVGRVIKCTCTSQVSISHEYIFKVDGTTKTAEGQNTPKNELSLTGTMALDNQDISCAIEYKDLGVTSPVATVRLAVFSTCACTAAPTKVAGVSLTTFGFVLLLSTLLMKE